MYFLLFELVASYYVLLYILCNTNSMYKYPFMAHISWPRVNRCGHNLIHWKYRQHHQWHHLLQIFRISYMSYFSLFSCMRLAKSKACKNLGMKLETTEREYINVKIYIVFKCIRSFFFTLSWIFVNLFANLQTPP